jgi:hypothetical protein
MIARFSLFILFGLIEKSKILSYLIILFQETEHAGIRTFRFIPPENALGSHEDPNPARNNPDNECYCMKKDVSAIIVLIK